MLSTKDLVFKERPARKFAMFQRGSLHEPYFICYELRLKELSDRTTLVLSNTRELDRVPNTK